MADIRVVATGLRFPEGPVAMADGSVILGEIAGGAVTRIAPDGGKREIGKAGGGPNGLALGPDDALYVCNNGGNVYEATPAFLSTGPSPDYKGGSIQRIDPKTDGRPDPRRSDYHPDVHQRLHHEMVPLTCRHPASGRWSGLLCRR